MEATIEGIDKSEWGNGEWQNEPDKVQWIDQVTGLPCFILRNFGGALCGYVGITSEHPFFGKDYNHRVEVENLDEVELHPEISPMNILAEAFSRDEGSVSLSTLLRCHGGVTYSGKIFKSFDCESLGLENNNTWLFGFDCSHHGDYSPAYGIGSNIYRNIDYVKEECRMLAQQLHDMRG